jgi:hypothetical protein
MAQLAFWELKINIDGTELTFYYTKNANGVDIYYFNESKNTYELLMPVAPSYKTVIEAIRIAEKK